MEKNKTIIIILLLIILLLGISLGAVILNNKQECKLKMTSENSVSKGDDLKLKLTNSNNTPIKNATISIKISNKNHTYRYNATTNEKGIAKITLKDLKSGKYNVNCTYHGNSKYKSTKYDGKLKYSNKVTTTSSDTESNYNSIDANRPVNQEGYKGYNPNHESEVTSDGWNPREHEVSRKTLSDGNQEIRYDDGYFRLVDKNGYVITYGYR